LSDGIIIDKSIIILWPLILYYIYIITVFKIFIKFFYTYTNPSFSMVVTNPSLSRIVTNPGLSSIQKKSHFDSAIEGEGEAETLAEIEADGLAEILDDGLAEILADGL